MTTSGKVLIVLVALVTLPTIYFGAVVLNLESKWHARVDDLQKQAEQLDARLADAALEIRDTQRRLATLQYSWGRKWTQVAAVRDGNEVAVEIGQREGLIAGGVLYAFALGGEGAQPVYLGQFQVSPNNLAEHSASLSLFPPIDADGSTNMDPEGVEQQNLTRRLQLLDSVSGRPWLMHTDLPQGYKQQLLTWMRMHTQQVAYTNSAEMDRQTWEGAVQLAQQNRQLREQELQDALAAAPLAEDQRNVEVRALHEMRQELAQTVARLRQVLEENKDLARRIAELEEQVLTASGGLQAAE